MAHLGKLGGLSRTKTRVCKTLNYGFPSLHSGPANPVVAIEWLSQRQSNGGPPTCLSSPPATPPLFDFNV